MAITDEFRSIFTTSFGEGVVYASECGVFKVDLPDTSQAVISKELLETGFKSSCLTERAAALLHRYFTGVAVDFMDLPVELPGISPFRCKALRTIRSIPYGAVCTYEEIAIECGSPRAARAVGGAMASNPVPIIIPCHRVIGSSGRLTGFSAPGGEELKLKLLKMEGIEFKGLLAIKKSLVMNR